MDTYRIRSGDTLTLLARHHDLTLEELLQLNPQIDRPDRIFVGQTINVPDANSEAAVSIHRELAGDRARPWYGIAMREMETGVDEIPGPQHNPRILEYHQSTTLRATDDETPWCSSFVNWCMEQAGHPGTRSALARSWLAWGRPLEEPRKGCVVVLQRGQHPTQGHVGFLHGRERDRLLVLGGNQGDQVNIRSYPADRLLGYRWPEAPSDARLAAAAAGAALTREQLQRVMKWASDARIDRFLAPLGAAMDRNGIDTPLRRAHFLAQLGHESGSLRYTEEIADGTAYEGREDLGNVEPGDGPRFKGRGLIQLTGRANYREYGRDAGLDLLSTPEHARVLATDDRLAADVAGWFWRTLDLNALADADDLRAVTRRINGGLNGLNDRADFLERARLAFGVGAGLAAAPAPARRKGRARRKG